MLPLHIWVSLTRQMPFTSRPKTRAACVPCPPGLASWHTAQMDIERLLNRVVRALHGWGNELQSQRSSNCLRRCG